MRGIFKGEVAFGFVLGFWACFIIVFTTWLLGASAPVEVHATVPQWISAATGFFALCIAWRASMAWQKTLIARRGDDVLIAAYDFSGEIGKLISAVERGDNRERFGQGVDSLFASLRQLTKSYFVAQRSYKPELPDHLLDDLRAKAIATQRAGEVAYKGNLRPDPIDKLGFFTCAKDAQITADKLFSRLKRALA